MFKVYTVGTAQEVVDHLNHMLVHHSGMKHLFFFIAVEREIPDGVLERDVHCVRVLGTEEEASIMLADGSQVIRCITEDGRRLDILLGDPEKRETDRAVIFFEKSD